MKILTNLRSSTTSRAFNPFVNVLKSFNALKLLQLLRSIKVSTVGKVSHLQEFSAPSLVRKHGELILMWQPAYVIHSARPARMGLGHRLAGFQGYQDPPRFSKRMSHPIPCRGCTFRAKTFLTFGLVDLLKRGTTGSSITFTSIFVLGLA